MKSYKVQLAISSGVILACLIVFTLVFQYFANNLEKRSLDMAQQRAQIIKISRTAETLAAYKNQVPLVAQYEKLIALFLPVPDDLLDFPKWLEDLSHVRQVGVIFNFSGEPVPAAGNTPGYAPFTLRLTGTYDNIQEFLGDVETRTPKYLVNLDSLELGSAGGTNYSFTVSGRVYLRAPNIFTSSSTTTP